MVWGLPKTAPKTNPQFLQGSGIFAPSPDTTKGHVTSPHSSYQVRHTLKTPRDQSPPAPPATQKKNKNKTCIQPIVFNIVFYPHSTLSLFFSTGKSRTCDTSTTGQSPVSSQPDQNKQLSTRFLNTSSSWLKFHKLFYSYRIGTSASSLRQTKINTNCSKNTMLDITECYP